MTTSWPRSAAAGAAYFALVFAAGFCMGVIRVGQIAPRTGDLIAVCIELPFMLTISWVICQWLLTRLQIANVLSSRILMSVVAFTFLMMAELMMSIFLFGNTVALFLAGFQEPHALVGLAGQIVFALFPVIALRSSTASARHE